MTTVNIHAAKTHLSRLIDQAAAGEEIIIARAGKPMVRLVPVQAMAGRRKLGGLSGKIRLSDDFDAPLPDDIIDSFEGR
ncbi:type II toxin-antitoxin system Phd/YefM family antitoxin [Marinivivus vitaminiproducens]|uniref:type II toxin-antitoxin system Phd/YefM family antitoxin n=1 Tax=Marinivivus vitaminiproducens TaxID=3035935 RepID=UPI00279A6783|nr:type II toxin-antitoxin system Phd/YefM family antitoxin [Geminicoccaceae bacterium SCSIO 64248]